MAEDEIVQPISIPGIAEATKSIEELGARGAAAFEQLAAAAEKMNRAADSFDKAASGVKKVGDEADAAAKKTSDAADAAKKASDNFDGVSGATRLFGRTLGEAGQAAAEFGKAVGAVTIAVGALGAAFLKFVKSGADVTDKLRDAAIAAGTTIENYQKLGFAVEQNGGKMRDLDRALGAIANMQGKADKAADGHGRSLGKLDDVARKNADTFGKGLSEAYSKYREELGKAGGSYEKVQRASENLEKSTRGFSKTYAEAMREVNTANGGLDRSAAVAENAVEKLGVKLKDASGNTRDSTEIFKDIADKISKIKDPAQQVSAAVQVFGRRMGPQLVQALQQGRSGLEAFGKDAERLGLIVDTATAKIGGDFNDSLSKVTTQFQRTRAQFALSFAPDLTRLLDALADSFAKLTPGIIATGKAIAENLRPYIDDLIKILNGEGGKVESPVIKTLYAAVVALGIAFDVVIGTVKVFNATLNGLFAIINSIFGTKFKAGDFWLTVALLAAGGAAAKLIGLLGRLTGVTALASLAKSAGLLPTAFRLATAAVNVFSAGLLVAARGVLAFNLAAAPWLILIAAIGAAIGFLVVTLLKLDWKKLLSGDFGDLKKKFEVFTKYISDTWKKIVDYFKNTSISNIIRDAFVALVPLIGTVMAQFLNIVVQTLAGIGAAFVQGLIYVVGVVRGWLTQLVAYLASTQLGQAVIAGLQYVKDAFNSLTAYFTGLISIVGGIFTQMWDYVKSVWVAAVDYLSGIIQSIKDFFLGIYEYVVEVFTNVKNYLGETWDSVKAKFLEIWESLKTYFMDSWAGSIVKAIQYVIEWVGKLIASFKKASEESAKANTGGDSAVKKAMGGHIRGPGTSTSDSIPAWLSNNEFVMRARAVRKYGLGFMRAINSGRLRLPQMPAFAGGGLVRAVTPARTGNRFAGGGLAVAGGGGMGGGGRSEFTLALAGGPSVQVSAPTSAVQEIFGHVSRMTRRSAGDKPGHYGGGKRR